MKSKLGTKFLILALIVAALGFALYAMPLKKGIDLEGGHSLTFAINTEGLESTQGLSETMIDILKERVDPLGLMSLEWRPVAGDRIEVRMPAGSVEARRAKIAYQEALETLADRNIAPADIRRLVSADPEQQQAILDELAGQNEQRRALLARQVEGYNAVEQAREQLQGLEAQLSRLQDQAVPSVADLEALRGQLAEAQARYDDARAAQAEIASAVRATNVNTRELANALQLYVPPRVADQMERNEVERRTSQLGQSLDRFRAQHAADVEMIDQVVDRYTAWARVRGRLDDPQDLIRLIQRAGVLEYRLAPRIDAGEGVTIDAVTARFYLQQLSEEGPQGGRDRGEPFQWFPVRGEAAQYARAGMIVGEWGGADYMLLSNQPGQTMLRERGHAEWALADARPTTDDSLRPAVGFSFDDRGANLFAALTGTYVGDILAVLLDDEVYSAPRINQQIRGQGIIQGDFTPDEVHALVRTLRSGSLPARLNPEPVSVNSVGATLGEANIQRGTRAAVIGLLCVVSFMAVYYLMSGLIADLALALNVIMLLGAMALLEATFTLPGIAGLILTFGIAVDANVLIFERLREEQAKNQSLRMAIKNAYDKAFSAIIDGNITTLLTCVILGWVGTQEVRGFAITLGLGILISLFTSLLVTRWVYLFLSESGLVKNKFHMLKLVGLTHVDWMGKRRAFWAVSGLLLVLGIAALISQGGNILGIEFRTGTRAVVRFEDDAMIDGQLLNDQRVAQRLSERATVETMSGQNVQVNTMRSDTPAQDFLAVYDSDADGAVSAAEWAQQGRNPAFFAAIDADGDQRLTSAELADRLPATRYQITTLAFDPHLVRAQIDDAFGGLLAVQTALDHQMIQGATIPGLNIQADPTGLTRINQQLADDAAAIYRPILEDNVDGALFAFSLPDEQAIDEADLLGRIQSTRLQAGRDTLQVVEIDAIALTPVAGGDKATAWAVLVRSGDVDVDDPSAWQQFASSELEVLEDSLSSERSLESLTTFDPAMSRDTSQLAIVAIVLSWAAIILYLWLRFGSVRWGIAAVVCLVHDTLIVLGMVGLSAWIAATPVGRWLLIEPFKIDLAMIAAILTVIGYSVNDTIVVFDRIRENRGRLSTIHPNLINTSVNQTLGRTLLTSATTLMVVVVMYIWGGAGIHGFAFALMMGVIFGTYSSIAIASPLLMGFKRAIAAKAGPVTPAEEPAKVG